MYLYFIALLLYGSLCSAVTPTRNMIILYETGNENIQDTLEDITKLKYIGPGLGAISIYFLSALHQAQNPILVTEALLENINVHTHLFNEILNTTSEELSKKYGATYPRFNNKKIIED